jgi:hypothetical protein
MGIRVIQPEVEHTDQDALSAKVREYVWLDRQIKQIEAQKAEIKKHLSEVVETDGEADDKGHIWLTLPTEVEGIASLQRQRRVSVRLDEDAAERILTEKNLVEECYETVKVVNQDAVMAALFDGALTEDDLDLMYPKQVTWAFVPVKA